MSRRIAMEPCPMCASPDVMMVQLDSNHWVGTCRKCGAESDIHWSRPRARHLWNIDARATVAKRQRVGGGGPGGSVG